LKTLARVRHTHSASEIELDENRNFVTENEKDGASKAYSWMDPADPTKIDGSDIHEGLDGVPDGAVYGKVKKTALTAGEVDFSKAGVINKSHSYLTFGTDDHHPKLHKGSHQKGQADALPRTYFHTLGRSTLRKSRCWMTLEFPTFKA